MRAALDEFDAVWDALFPAEPASIVQLLVERVDVAQDGIDTHAALTEPFPVERDEQGQSFNTGGDHRIC